MWQLLLNHNVPQPTSLFKTDHSCGEFMTWEGIFAGGLLVLGGIFTLLGLKRRWKFFIGAPRVELVFQLLGERRAKIFYVLLSLLVIVLGILMMMGIRVF
jgi:hypothetical protein